MANRYVDTVATLPVTVVGALWAVDRYLTSRVDAPQVRVGPALELVTGQSGDAAGKTLLLHRMGRRIGASPPRGEEPRVRDGDTRHGAVLGRGPRSSPVGHTSQLGPTPERHGPRGASPVHRGVGDPRAWLALHAGRRFDHRGMGTVRLPAPDQLRGRGPQASRAPSVGISKGPDEPSHGQSLPVERL